MKRILVLILMLYSSIVLGQTFTGDVDLISQAEVVSFGANNYTTIDGNVAIGAIDGSNISDLSTLNSWQIITGRLYIDNTDLTTLTGLNSLNAIGPVVIPGQEGGALDLQNNTMLADISALSGLSSIAGIRINFNQSLSSLEGLQNVTETTEVRILQNASLTDFSGLNGLSDIYGLTVENNAGLTSFNGLQNLIGPLHFIKINDNSELLNLNALFQVTSGPGFYGETIANNIKLTSFCGLYQLLNTAPATAILSITGNAQNPTQQDIVNSGPCSYTSIPDDNFEAYLIAQNIDTEQIADNRVLTSDISGIISLNVNTQNISDLTGIEDFTLLQQLWAWNNTLTSLNVSQNSVLNDLQIYNNQIGSIDLTNNPNLAQLNVSNNNFSNLDVSQNLQLNGLNIGTNNIAAIDLSNNSNLGVLAINNNPISAIDVSANTNLVFLNLNFNPNLSNVNAANGSNTSLVNLYTSGSPNLNCIQVDDIVYAEQETTNGNWIKDPSASYLLDCSVLYTAIPDDNFEQALIDRGLDANPILDDRVLTSAIENETFLNLTGNIGSIPETNPNLLIRLDIADLTGIEGFTNLQTLFVQGNDLTTLDLSNNLELIDVRAFYNELMQSVNINGLANLQIIGLNNNQISSIDVSTNTSLETFDIANNQLTSIDLSNLTNLQGSSLNGNNLSSITLGSSSSLTRLDISNNELTSLDISGVDTNLANFNATTNTNLTCIQVSNLANVRGGWNKDAGAAYSVNCGSSAIVEFSQVSGQDFEAVAGNLPRLLITGTITNPSTITINDITTGFNVVPGTDYTFNDPTVVNIPVGVYDGTLNTAIDIPSLTILDDDVFQSRGTLSFELNSFSGDISAFGATTTTSYDIIDDDYTAVIVATDLEASEEGLQGAGYSILLNAAVDTGVVVNVNYTVSGVATNGVDYEVLSGVAGIIEGTNTADIQITPIQDILVEGTENLIITLDTGTLYRVGDPSEASIDILDNEIADFTLSKNTVATTEPNGSDTFTVVLDAQPSTGVRFNITPSLNPDEFSIDALILNFTNANWNIPQTVTVTGQDDGLVDGNQDYEFVIAIDDANSNDAFDPLPNRTITGTNADDDTLGSPGFALSKNNVVTAEPNSTDSFTVVLSSQPTTDVVIEIISDDTSEALLSPSSITFTNANWNTPQTIIVTGQDDALVDGPQNYQLTLSVDDPNSDDAFDSLANQILTGTNSDDEVPGTPGFALSKNIVATSEPNGTDSFTVLLDSQPLNDVVIDILSSNTGEAIVTPTSLIFSNANWNEPQTVTVTGQDDNIVDGTQNFFLTLSVNDAASDDTYDALPDQTVNGTNADDDVAGTPGFTLSKNIVSTSEPNATDSFTIVLNLQPVSDVVIDILSNNTGEAIVTPTSLTFSNANWNIPQNITVNGQDDNIVDGTQNFVLTLSVNDAVSDDNYDALPDQTVNGTNADDDVEDTPGPDLSQEDISVFVTSATCPDINNGEILIEAFANYTFNVSINNESLINTVSPNNELLLNSLPKGTYDICLSITQFPGWEQCYTAIISNFEDLVVDLLEVDSIDQTVQISLEGSKSYEVKVNEKEYTYDFNNTLLKKVKIPLESGTNKIIITGHSDCQGIFKGELTIEQVKYYPNPVVTSVHIDGLPTDKTINLKVFNTSGKLVLSDSQSTTGGKVIIDLQSLSAGWYFLKIIDEKTVLEYKIIKK